MLNWIHRIDNSQVSASVYLWYIYICSLCCVNITISISETLKLNVNFLITSTERSFIMILGLKYTQVLHVLHVQIIIVDAQEMYSTM